MRETESEGTLIHLWRFFSSARLAITLLILLAIASILGTIIPQREEAMEFARGLGPGLFRFFSALDLFDMYHAVWFRLLIACLALNLIVCSTDRFPGTWRRFRALPRPDRQKPFKGLPSRQTFVIPGHPKDDADLVVHFLKSRYKRIRKKETEKGHFFYLDKGRHANFGFYLVHLSLIIIIIGALAGSLLGFEAYVNILEGETVKTVTLRSGMKPLKLGFAIRCEKFKMELYDNGAPKEYRSDLLFLVDGKAVKRNKVLVNHPVQFKGITFYQSSYGTVPGKHVRLKITRQASAPESAILEAELGKVLPLPGNGGKFQVADVRGDFMGMGPAVQISVHEDGGKKTRFWVFKNHEAISKRYPGIFEKFPKLNPSAFRPFTFFLDKLESVYYTGLQVNKDPGVPIVWTGCFLMIMGFMVTFFTSHRRIWVRMSGEKSGIRISVAGTSSKNPVGLQRDLEHLTHDLRDLFEKRDSGYD